MNGLIYIQDYVQIIADTIASVIGVDVTIVDRNNIRVAGTGKYKEKIGQKLVKKSVFTKSMIENKSYIVKNPKYEEVCYECPNKNTCIEFSEVCSPIVMDKKVIGVIGLVAFSLEQKKALESNVDNLLEFLKKMGDLLSTKLWEAMNQEKQKILLKQIETIINSIDDGIIALGENKDIIYINKKVEEILGGSNIKKNLTLRKLIEEADINRVLQFGKEIKNLQVTYENIRVVINAKPIELEKKIIGAVVVLRTIKDINRIINDISITGIYTEFNDIIGISKEINEIKDKAKKASQGNSTILILGESGTGKELFARAIHNCSKRKDKPFIAINCAAIPESLLESELFGYEEGAFTGAKKGGKIGKFELANGGTIFLDEIGDMPLHLQTKLLRVIQDRSIEKIGSTINIPIDVRIIAATHKDLENMVTNGEFRQDLYYRINVIPIKIPPLRQRKEDIKILTQHILEKCKKKLSKNIKGIDEEAYNMLMKYSWFGNVRELENVIEYAVNMETGEYLTPFSLPIRIKEDEKNDYDNCNLRYLEKKAIEQVLRKYKNRDEAAKILGIGRATLFRKIKEYKIKVSE
ncbi:Fis family transcriptional regulator [Fervidicella metallireducens AeB]|uniref:Fis family transcriptional regulator n=1 Tax=Fervidicella metallireducens AeB TaxID=1403537 RepID=A0A017RXK1_9CLOT|nr:sigma 54-interacting transcriptional regulator [Fervidicella metallireducens]EYE88655.1 Fis family transcriptional regulator [Fervidicella metallireducens AeB]